MLEIASQMILCLLLAALIGAIIGYLLGKRTCADDDCGETTPVASADSDLHVSESVTHTETSNIAATHGIAAVTTGEASPDLDGDMSGEEAEITENSSLVLLDGPRNGVKDNLTRIKGIGLKIDEALNTIGIYHFDQIAAWNEENIAWADETLGFPGRAKREQWVEQAAALATGEETEFSKRVDKGEVSSSKKD